MLTQSKGITRVFGDYSESEKGEIEEIGNSTIIPNSVIKNIKKTDLMPRNINQESLLWQRVKKGLTDCFLTRIETSTLNGVPDVHGVHKQGIFWIELKSDQLSFPKLNKWQIVWINKYVKAGGHVFILKETLSKRSLKLYRPVSSFTDPRSLVSFASFSFPLQWPTVQRYLLGSLQEAA